MPKYFLLFIATILFTSYVRADSAAPQIVFFKADPEVIVWGEHVRLSWEVGGAVYVEISYRQLDQDYWTVILKNWPLKAKHQSVGKSVHMPLMFRLVARSASGDFSREIIHTSIAARPKLKGRCTISGVVKNLGDSKIELGLYKDFYMRLTMSLYNPVQSTVVDRDGRYTFSNILPDKENKYKVDILGSWRNKNLNRGRERIVACENDEQFTMDIDLNSYEPIKPNEYW